MCLSLEAMRGELAAFDPRLQRARPHPASRVARNLLRILAGTKRCSQAARESCFPMSREARNCPLRPGCRTSIPPLHAAGPRTGGEAVEYVERIVGTEMNSATDNPLIFEDGTGGYESISGGHFHGQYVAQAMDVLAIAMADLSAISERRLARLIDPTMSGLPRNLWPASAGSTRASPRCNARCRPSSWRTGASRPPARSIRSRQVERRRPRRELDLVRAKARTIVEKPSRWWPSNC